VTGRRGMSEQTTRPADTKPPPDLRPEGDPFRAGTREHKPLLPAGPDGTREVREAAGVTIKR
jgi:hypothetical protein